MWEPTGAACSAGATELHTKKCVSGPPSAAGSLPWGGMPGLLQFLNDAGPEQPVGNQDGTLPEDMPRGVGRSAEQPEDSERPKQLHGDAASPAHLAATVFEGVKAKIATLQAGVRPA